MNATNLRPEAGGDPARSHSDDLKNDPVVSKDGNDFPDAPASSAAAKSQDEPDLDKFAAKLGTDTIESGAGLDAVPDRSGDDASDPRPIFAAAAAVAGLIGLVVWRRTRKSRLGRIADTLDVTTVFS